MTSEWISSYKIIIHGHSRFDPKLDEKERNYYTRKYKIAITPPTKKIKKINNN